MNKLFYILSGATLLILTILFIGIYHNPEFYWESSLFLKHRPTLKVNFYTPIGESDRTLETLPDNLRKEEAAYQEYVIQQGVLTPGHKHSVPLLLIQATLTVLINGLYSSFRQCSINIWKLGLHFGLCLLPTTLAVGFIFNFHNLSSTIIFSCLSLFFNTLVVHLLMKKSIRKFERGG